MTPQKHYELMIAAGESPRMAEMLALRQAPGTGLTDRAFLEGTHEPFAGIPNYQVREYLAAAYDAGIPTTGRVYKSCLADWRGARDPAAWVQGIDDARAVCRKRNLNYFGEAVEKPPQPDVRLASDIVERLAREQISKDPGLNISIRKDPKKIREVREEIIEKHGAPKK